MPPGGARYRSGPPKTPAVLQHLRNNSYGHAIPKPAVQPGPWTGQPPEWLTGRGLAWWHKHEAMFMRLGLLTEADDEMFALLAASWGQFAEMTLAGKTEGVAYATLVNRIRALSAAFGTDPAARMRIQVSGAAKDDPVEAYRTQRKGAA